MIPFVFDHILFPLVLVLAGMLTASRPLLRALPFLHGVVELLTRLRNFLGLAALTAGIVELFLLPVLSAHPARIAAIISALIIGFTLTFDTLVSSRHARRENLPVIWLGNLLMHIRDYTGTFTLVLGFLYIFII